MSDDATLARAREVFSKLEPLDGEESVNLIAAALRAYGDERERQGAEEDAKIANRFRVPTSGSGLSRMVKEAINQTVDWIAEAIRARGEKEAGR